MTRFSYAELAILASFLVSCLSLVGIVFLKVKSLTPYTRPVIALAVGSLLGDVFFHILPEITEQGPWTISISLALIAAILVSFLLEGLLRWQHCHSPEEIGHHHHLGYLNLFADGIHNFLDGVAIAAAFAVSPQVGLVTTVAIILHEIPHELGNYVILLSSGFTKQRALFFNFLSAVTAMLGTIFTILFLDVIQNAQVYVAAFAAGSLLYIAMSDMIPEVHERDDHDKRFDWISFLLILVGLGLLLALRGLE